MIKSIYVLGAGLYGCLTALKIKQRYPNKSVKLVDTSDHLIPVFDPIIIHGNKLNNGFHGIEVPRAQEFYEFVKNELHIETSLKKAVKKLNINGHIVDYKDKLDCYPDNIKKFYIPEKIRKNTTLDEMVDSLSDEFKILLKEVSLRYSDDIESVMHLLVPWFCPADYMLNSADEGDEFRNLVRSDNVESYYAWPSSGLFCELQTGFDRALRAVNVEFLFNRKVLFSDEGISISSTSQDTPVNIPESDLCFLCMPPIGILKHVDQKSFADLIASPRHLYQVLLVGESAYHHSPFTEILCCDPSMASLSRISRPTLRQSDKESFQLELFVSPNDDLDDDFIPRLVEYMNKVMPEVGFGKFRFVGLQKSRTVYFPSGQTTEIALKKVDSWSSRFSNVHTLKAFGPINMSKTWLLSNQNLDIVS